MKDFAKEFYKSSAWLKCRAAFISKRLAIDGGMCQRCGEQPGYIVHHIIELNAQNINDSNITLRHSNMQYVCHDCHNEIHGIAVTVLGRECIFDSNGEVTGVKQATPHEKDDENSERDRGRTFA